MIDAELQAEGLTVLPLRLETISIRGGNVHQDSYISQRNFSNQIGGNSLYGSNDQFNFQSNYADVDQDVDYRIRVHGVIEDNRRYR